MRCEDCGWARILARELAHLQQQLRTPWARDLLEAYHRECRLSHLSCNWAHALRRDVAFFVELEQTFATQDEISAVMIVRKLGNAFVKKYPRALSFLASKHIILMEGDPDFELERRLEKIRGDIAATDGWVHEVLDHFLNVLLTARDRQPKWSTPKKPESIESAINAARGLLIFARDDVPFSEVTDLRQITQEHVDLYLARKPGSTVGLSSFVRYLNAPGRLFAKVKLPKFRSKVPIHKILPEEKTRQLLQWATAARGADVRSALIILFALVYAQRPCDAAGILLEDITRGPEGTRIRFAKVALDLDPVVEEVLDRWMDQRREISAFESAGESAFLFPGSRATTHYQGRAISLYLCRLSVSKSHLFATAIAALIRGGLTQPTVLVDCFGVSRPTATKYCEALGALETVRARTVLDRYGRR